MSWKYSALLLVGLILGAGVGYGVSRAREFETMEDFAKMWNDERQQQLWARWANLVDNARIRLLRPSLTIPEDLK